MLYFITLNKNKYFFYYKIICLKMLLRRWKENAELGMTFIVKVIIILAKI